jgi:hypothetical protein
MEEKRSGRIQKRLITLNLLILFLILVIFLIVYFRDQQMLKQGGKQPPPAQTNQEVTTPLPAELPAPASTAMGPEERIPPAQNNSDFDNFEKERRQQKNSAGTPME